MLHFSRLFVLGFLAIVLNCQSYNPQTNPPLEVPSEMATWGSIGVPVGSSTYQDENILLRFYITQKTITIVAKINSYSGFDLRFSSPALQQVKTSPTCLFLFYHFFEISIFQGDLISTKIMENHNIAMQDMFYKNSQPPQVDSIQNHIFMGFATDNKTSLTVKFMRKLDTADRLQDDLLTKGQPFTFSYSLNSDSPTPAPLHVFSGVLFNNQTYRHGVFSKEEVILHGIVLTLAWCFVADFAIWSKYFYGYRSKTCIHIFLMIAAAVATIIMTFRMILSALPLDRALNSVQKTHFVVGIMVICWMIIQICLGFMHRLSGLYSQFLNPNFAYAARWLHRTLGYIFLLLVKTNVIIGWVLFDNVTALAIVGTEIFINLCIFVIVKYHFTSKKASAFNMTFITNTEPLSPSNSGRVANIHFTSNKCDQKVEELLSNQRSTVVIFNNKIYSIAQMDFHPGGKALIDGLKVREIDRYIYGMCSLQTIDNRIVPAFAHPQSFLKLLSQSLGQITSSTLYRLPSHEFRVADSVAVNSASTIFYLSCISQSLYFSHEKTLDHLGQYFTVECNGRTKLYSCVSCLRPFNRKFVDDICKKEGIPILEAEHRFLQANPNESLQTLCAQDPTAASHETLPLLVKINSDKYDSFTNYFTTNIQPIFKISGLNGRGLGLNKTKSGHIVIIVGGSGLFPFLDLIDVLFKLKVSQKNQKLDKFVSGYRTLLNNKTFTLFGSFGRMSDLIVPTQFAHLDKISEHDGKIDMFLRFTSEPARKGVFRPETLLRRSQRFDSELISSKLGSRLDEISMVYICGPERMYREVHTALREIPIPEEKITHL